MITFIKSHESGKIVRREYSAPTHSEASLFVHIYGGVYIKLQENYYRVII